MKLSRTTRGASAPPGNLTSASLRLTHATRLSRVTHQQTPPPHRLGSPFSFHPIESRPGTPSTVTSEAPKLPPRPYWLRSSRETEWEYHINNLKTPSDLRVLIEQAFRAGEQRVLNWCRGILMAALGRYYVGDLVQDLGNSDLGGLVQHADRLGFWGLNVLPVVPLLHNSQGDIQLLYSVVLMSRYG